MLDGIQIPESLLDDVQLNQLVQTLLNGGMNMQLGFFKRQQKIRLSLSTSVVLTFGKPEAMAGREEA